MQTTSDSRRDLLKAKKLLYLHGFASSGQSGTVKSLRMLLPEATVIAPDIPISPKEALPFLQDLVQKEQPDLIIGTSMGAMYAQLMGGHDRILVNPAFEIASTLVSRNMLGKITFHNPRKDGQTDFLLTKSILQEFKEVTSLCFKNLEDDKDAMVYGLFGREDDVVDTYDEFKRHYRDAIRFDGGHHLNDHAIIRSLLPVIQWIDDKRSARQRPCLLFDLEHSLVDLRRDPFSLGSHEISTAGFAFRKLSQTYDSYIVASSRPEVIGEARDKMAWAELNMGVGSYDRLILTSRKSLIMADYLVTSQDDEEELEAFMGTVIRLGSDTYKSWEDIISYFELLGGQ